MRYPPARMKIPVQGTETELKPCEEKELYFA
jgi:hypothetical protein